MKQELKRRKVDLDVINEYNTSKMCHECFFKHPPDESPMFCVMDKYDYDPRPSEYPKPEDRERFSNAKNKEKFFRTCPRTYSKIVGCKFNCGTIMNRYTKFLLFYFYDFRIFY